MAISISNFKKLTIVACGNQDHYDNHNYMTTHNYLCGDHSCDELPLSKPSPRILPALQQEVVLSFRS